MRGIGKRRKREFSLLSNCIIVTYHQIELKSSNSTEDYILKSLGINLRRNFQKCKNLYIHAIFIFFHDIFLHVGGAITSFEIFKLFSVFD